MPASPRVCAHMGTPICACSHTHTHMFLSFLIFWVSSLFFLLFSSFLGSQCISFPSFSFFFFWFYYVPSSFLFLSLSALLLLCFSFLLSFPATPQYLFSVGHSPPASQLPVSASVFLPLVSCSLWLRLIPVNCKRERARDPCAPPQLTPCPGPVDPSGPKET